MFVSTNPEVLKLHHAVELAGPCIEEPRLAFYNISSCRLKFAEPMMICGQVWKLKVKAPD
jgi:hypothetical protein